MTFGAPAHKSKCVEINSLHTRATNVAQPRAAGAKHDRAGHESTPVAGRRFCPGLRNTVVLLLRDLSDRHLAQPQAPRLQVSERSAGPPGQIKRDIRASISSFAAISFLFTPGAWFHYQFGWGYKIHQMTIANTIVSFGFSMLVFDTWFHWFHRLLHTRWFFKHIHHWYHLIRTPVVWSNDSETLADNCFLQSYWAFAYFMFPISPIVLLAHKIYDLVTGCIGHSGYEYAGRLSLHLRR